MKKALLGSVLALTVASFGASAADMISKDEAHHFKLEYLGNVSVGASGGQISSPSDLHQKLSKLADEKGGKYYVIIAAREHGPKEGANKQVISSQADSLIKISRIWADFFPANTSNQPI
ncbi:Protein of uncharacterised function (DUF1471) [Enterobacter hormaechei]|nr:Protein of uncharacterised function (DUF1471) [Enterobacter hormaechei]